MKPKFTVEQQIEHMKEQNIKFNHYSETDATSFLKEANYYFKVKAFAKNYKKINGQYTDLDFAYLRKFSILDTLFRDLVLELSLLCEHLLKTKICYESSINQKDDGYAIVSDFIQKYGSPKNLQRYNDGNISIYLKNLVEHYHSTDMPIWVFIEILEFGELIKFYKFYFDNFNLNNKNMAKIWDLYSISSLRNAAAHNSCVLHTLAMWPLTTKTFKTSTKLKQFLKSKKLISRSEKEIRIPLIHDFLCLMFTINNICPPTKTRIILKRKIINYFRKCEKHKEYFDSNRIIVDRYAFIKNATIKILRMN